MKKWIICLLISMLAAGAAFSEEGRPWWKLGFGRKGAAEEYPAPPAGRLRQGHVGPEGRQRPQMNAEQRAKMEQFRAQRDAVAKLAEAARSETDPVKQEELVSQLRAKLTEGAEKMQEAFRDRLEKAEGDVAKMKERLAEAEKNQEQRIEEHLQKLLSGERPARPEGAPRKKGPPPVE